MQNLDEDVFDDLLAAGIPDVTVGLVLAAMAGSASLDAVVAGEQEAPRPDPTTERTSPQGTLLTGGRGEGCASSRAGVDRDRRPERLGQVQPAWPRPWIAP